MSDNIVQLSVVIPLFNEVESAPRLYEQLRSVLESMGLNYELIFIDDGSSDSTFELVSSLAQKDNKLKLIKFRRNYGQTPAMAAGIDYAKGELIITMDGDLQNDPNDIPDLVAKIKEGNDIVVGWRHNRQDKLISRKIPSVIANWLIGKVTGIPIKDNGCSLKAYRADVIKDIPLYSEMHRFIPAMASLSGATVAEIKVRHHARQFGASKYGLSRIFKVIVDLLMIKTLISFATRPFQWFAVLSVPFVLLSVALILAVLIQAAVSGLSIPLPIAGMGILFAALAIFLLGAGALGELVYFFGELYVEKLYIHTANTISTSDRLGQERNFNKLLGQQRR